MATVHTEIQSANPAASNTTNTVFLERVREQLRKHDLQVECLLGRGGFGSVYRCRCLKSDCIVAVKVLSKDEARRANMQNRVINEVTLHRTLDHPHIIHVRDLFEDDINIYLILDCVNYGDMYRYIKHRTKEGKLTVDCTRHFLYQLLLALQYIHGKDQGIMHRDLKLSNLLLHYPVETEGTTNDSSVSSSSPSSQPSYERLILRLCDFGLAVKCSTNGSPTNPTIGDTTEQRNHYVIETEEEHRTVCGTPAYMAPEVGISQPHGTAVDIFSAGCLFYFMLIGKAPMQKITTTNNHTHNPTTPITDNNPLHSEGLVDNGDLYNNPQNSQEKRYVRTELVPDYVSNLTTIDPLAKDLIQKLMNPVPSLRPTATEALQHPFFTTVRNNINNDTLTLSSSPSSSVPSSINSNSKTLSVPSNESNAPIEYRTPVPQTIRVPTTTSSSTAGSLIRRLSESRRIDTPSSSSSSSLPNTIAATIPLLSPVNHNSTNITSIPKVVRTTNKSSSLNITPSPLHMSPIRPTKGTSSIPSSPLLSKVGSNPTASSGVSVGRKLVSKVPVVANHTLFSSSVPFSSSSVTSSAALPTPRIISTTSNPVSNFTPSLPVSANSASKPTTPRRPHPELPIENHNDMALPRWTVDNVPYDHHLYTPGSKNNVTGTDTHQNTPFTAVPSVSSSTGIPSFTTVITKNPTVSQEKEPVSFVVPRIMDYSFSTETSDEESSIRPTTQQSTPTKTSSSGGNSTTVRSFDAPSIVPILQNPGSQRPSTVPSTPSRSSTLDNTVVHNVSVSSNPVQNVSNEESHPNIFNYTMNETIVSSPNRHRPPSVNTNNTTPRYAKGPSTPLSAGPKVSSSGDRTHGTSAPTDRVSIPPPSSHRPADPFLTAQKEMKIYEKLRKDQMQYHHRMDKQQQIQEYENKKVTASLIADIYEGKDIGASEVLAAFTATTGTGGTKHLRSNPPQYTQNLRYDYPSILSETTNTYPSHTTSGTSPRSPTTTNKSEESKGRSGSLYRNSGRIVTMDQAPPSHHISSNETVRTTDGTTIEYDHGFSNKPDYSSKLVAKKHSRTSTGSTVSSASLYRYTYPVQPPPLPFVDTSTVISALPESVLGEDNGTVTGNVLNASSSSSTVNRKPTVNLSSPSKQPSSSSPSTVLPTIYTHRLKPVTVHCRSPHRITVRILADGDCVVDGYVGQRQLSPTVTVPVHGALRIPSSKYEHVTNVSAQHMVMVRTSIGTNDETSSSTETLSSPPSSQNIVRIVKVYTQSLTKEFRYLYRMAAAVVRILRSRTPKVALISADCAACIMDDGPQPTFELRATTTISTTAITYPNSNGTSVFTNDASVSSTPLPYWSLQYRLRDHRLLVTSPTGQSFGCFIPFGRTGTTVSVPSVPHRSVETSSSVLRIVPSPSELPSHILCLYSLAMRVLQRCLGLQQSIVPSLSGGSNSGTKEGTATDNPHPEDEEENKEESQQQQPYDYLSINDSVSTSLLSSASHEDRFERQYPFLLSSSRYNYGHSSSCLSLDAFLQPRTSIDETKHRLNRRNKLGFSPLSSTDPFPIVVHENGYWMDDSMRRTLYRGEKETEGPKSSTYKGTEKKNDRTSLGTDKRTVPGKSSSSSSLSVILPSSIDTVPNDATPITNTSVSLRIIATVTDALDGTFYSQYNDNTVMSMNMDGTDIRLYRLPKTSSDTLLVSSLVPSSIMDSSTDCTSSMDTLVRNSELLFQGTPGSLPTYIRDRLILIKQYLSSSPLPEEKKEYTIHRDRDAELRSITVDPNAVVQV